MIRKILKEVTSLLSENEKSKKYSSPYIKPADAGYAYEQINQKINHIYPDHEDIMEDIASTSYFSKYKTGDIIKGSGCKFTASTSTDLSMSDYNNYTLISSKYRNSLPLIAYSLTYGYIRIIWKRRPILSYLTGNVFKARIDHHNNKIGLTRSSQPCFDCEKPSFYLEDKIDEIKRIDLGPLNAL